MHLMNWKVICVWYRCHTFIVYAITVYASGVTCGLISYQYSTCFTHVYITVPLVPLYHRHLGIRGSCLPLSGRHDPLMLSGRVIYLYATLHYWFHASTFIQCYICFRFIYLLYCATWFQSQHKIYYITEGQPIQCGLISQFKLSNNTKSTTWHDWIIYHKRNTRFFCPQIGLLWHITQNSFHSNCPIRKNPWYYITDKIQVLFQIILILIKSFYRWCMLYVNNNTVLSLWTFRVHIVRYSQTLS